MEKVNNPDKKVGNPQEDQIGIFNLFSNIPGNHKYSAGDNNTKNLCYTMKKQVVNATEKV